MSEGRGSALDAALALAIRVAGAGLVFALQVLLARLMPVDGYGAYVTLWTWMLALGSFAALGFAESSLRFLPRYHLRGRQEKVKGFWRFALRLVIVVSTLAAAAAALVALGVLGLGGAGLTVLLVALGLPLLAAEYLLEGVARSFGWFRLAAVPVYILRPLLIAVAAAGAWAAGIELTLPVVGAILLGAMGMVTLALALLIRQRVNRLAGALRAVPSRRQRRLWLAASLPLLLLSGLEDLTLHADVLLLSLLADPEQVGLYFAAARALALAGFVAYAMTLVTGRRFALDLAGRSRAQLQQSVLDSTRLTFWATLLAVGATLAASPILLGAFGPQFAAGQPVMAVLGLAMIIRSLSGQASEVLIVSGRQREALAIALGTLVVSVGLCVLLVPVLGMMGAAIASAGAMAVRSLGLIVVLQRREGLRVVSIQFPALGRLSARPKPGASGS